MEDSTIIWKFLSREYQNDHPVIFIYVCGQARSSKTAIDKVNDLVFPIFYPTISEHIIKVTIKGFLDMKKRQYIKGEFTPKPIYPNSIY